MHGFAIRRPLGLQLTETFFPFLLPPARVATSDPQKQFDRKIAQIYFNIANVLIRGSILVVINNKGCFLVKQPLLFCINHSTIIYHLCYE